MSSRPTPLIVLALVLSLQLAASACSTPGAPTPDPIEQAFSESKEVVITGIDEGFEDSESVDQYVVRARLNPCRCDAPRFEIYAHGRWTRVFLDGDEALVAEIDETLSRADGDVELTSLGVKGTLDGKASTPQGIKYPVFEVVAIEPVADEGP